MMIRRTQPQEVPKEAERDIYKEPGEINRFGVKILFDGKQWIIDAKTGMPARREGYECMEGQKGYFLWLKKGDKLRALDVPFPSIWDEKMKQKGTL